MPRIRIALSFVTAVAAVAGNGLAQFVWEQRTPATTPPPRVGHAMAFDADHGVVMMFGGFGPGGMLGDTWEWDGVNWTQRFPAHAPPPQSSHGVAHDSGRHRVVLVGGAPAQTWEWDGTDWLLVPTAIAPPVGGELAYDTVRSRIVYFGGSTVGPSPTGQTWEWDGATWFDRTSPSSPPSARWRAVFDSGRQRTVLVSSDSTVAPTQVWEWDGNAWYGPSTEPGPSAMLHAAVFDSVIERVLVWAGFASSSGALWAWNGVEWRSPEDLTSPPSRWSHAMAFDSARQRTVLFGGLASGISFPTDTWELSSDGAVMATAVPYGPRCGNPPLTVAPRPGSRPVLGSSQITDVQNAYLGIALVAWGFSDTTWSGGSLPAPLDPVGIEGCFLLQSAEQDIHSPCAGTSWNSAEHVLPVPVLSGIQGTRVFLQAWSLQPGLNTLGLVVSNGLELVLGDI